MSCVNMFEMQKDTSLIPMLLCLLKLIQRTGSVGRFALALQSPAASWQMYNIQWTPLVTLNTEDFLAQCPKLDASVQTMLQYVLE